MSVGRHSLFRYLYGIYERFCITAPAQMLGLAFLITAPAHPHAAWVAVYPAVYPAVHPAVHPALFVEGAAKLFSRVHATLQPALSVGRSVGWSVTLYFFL